MKKATILVIAIWIGMKVQSYISMFQETHTITVSAWDIFWAILSFVVTLYLGANLASAFKDEDY